jgi:hypothetical protein
MEDGCWHDFLTKEEKAVQHKDYVGWFESKYHRPYTFDNWAWMVSGRLSGCSMDTGKRSRNSFSMDDGIL